MLLLLLIFVCLFVCLFICLPACLLLFSLSECHRFKFACRALWLLRQSAVTRHFIILMMSGNTLSYKIDVGRSHALISKWRQIKLWFYVHYVLQEPSCSSIRFKLTLKLQNEFYWVYISWSVPCRFFYFVTSDCRRHPLLISIFCTPQ